MADHQEDNGDEQIQQRQQHHHRRKRQLQQQQRRVEVLDSSSSDEDSVRSGRGSSVSASHSQSSTSIIDNLSSNFSSSLAKNKNAAIRNALNAFDGVGVSNVKHGGGQEHNVETESTSEDEDEELMNPYVMNPFPNRNNGNTLVLDYSAALLPPSMELANMSSKKQGERGISFREDGEVPLQPLLSQQLPPLQKEEEEEEEEVTVSPLPVRTLAKTALASFDPYSSKPPPVAMQHSNRREPYYEMEMEEEESIDFFPNTDSINGRGNNDQSNPHTGKANGLNVFGPLLDEPPAPMNQGQSFSPFPKHRPRKDKGEYGESESSHLSSGFAARHGRGRRTRSSSSGGIGGIFGAVGAIGTMLKALVSSVAFALTSLLYGDPTRPAPHGNPFSDSRRWNVRMNHHHQHWGMLSYVRLFVVSMAALFCVGTMTMMWHVPNGNDVGVEILQKSVYQNGEAGMRGDVSGGGHASHRPLSIVLKRMGEAKEKHKSRRNHWWNRNTAENAGRGEGGGRMQTEVYRQGEKQAVQPVVPLESSLNAAETLPVIVQTEEDGTLLIKLPPPKTNLQKPKAMGSAAPRMGSTENQSQPPLKKSLGDASDEETLYIKLPYPQQQQQQQQQRRTLTEMETPKQELEPPLRGAAMHDFHSPPPLQWHQESTTQHAHHVGGYHSHQEDHSSPGVLNALRNEFDLWIQKHEKKYDSGEEKEHRFHVWRKNHARLEEKNQKHGPCRMTGKAVFGHNMFSDLDPEEFQSRFLTGYRGPRGAHEHGHGRKKKKGGNGSHSYFRETTKRKTTEERPPPPAASVKRHPSIRRKLEEHTAMYGGGGSNGETHNSRLHGSKYQSNYLHGCSWWDVSCLLRWVFSYTSIGGTREPIYDENSYPSALDWRSMGVVTEVHSQGSCGACWAITAVETIESASAIKDGRLINLAEEEVIACDGTCEMCNGGWPQNAYEYVMKYEGLPEKSADYDADWLYTVTAVLAGESYDASEYEMGTYFAGTCPAGVREGGEEDGSGSQKSGDTSQYYDVSYVETTRYGHVKGYGYATDRCICYTDGSGCDCEEQDEKTAVLNVASYGPTAVCLEASLWQDYEGGIMTTAIGCSSSFLDMNHCVQVVGYAFTDGSSGGDDGDGSNDNGNSGSGSGSNDNKSGSGDDSEREGYWIVKNQWSSYWGMNGYAYVAMGENTCGILNDMTQVYMD
eukprot:CAMPEP_0201910366 /NCGR_PEP_ID=MMETSP0903-20130614/1764_1 /ASSEMBLY_ACC=CAM_ASM_000552 /TAXON_ID=420261 /ORGANISM="Thalassiosira antarctica, Strain CCMP982" /LENGTH=1191 /DNA_ID=CAMNT_0048444987 /DNA_START=94 /DNA_END=3669 /DNA_ORIENTATION=-